LKGRFIKGGEGLARYARLRVDRSFGMPFSERTRGQHWLRENFATERGQRGRPAFSEKGDHSRQIMGGGGGGAKLLGGGRSEEEESLEGGGGNLGQRENKRRKTAMLMA